MPQTPHPLLRHSSKHILIQIEFVDFTQNFGLALMNKKFFVESEILFTAVSADESGAVFICCKLGYENNCLIHIKSSSDLSVLTLLFTFLPNIEQPENSCYLLLVCI